MGGLTPAALVRTGVWAIEPKHALHWAQRTAPPPRTPPQAALHAFAVVAMVVVAGLLGGFGAWAVTP